MASGGAADGDGLASQSHARRPDAAGETDSEPGRSRRQFLAARQISHPIIPGPSPPEEVAAEFECSLRPGLSTWLQATADPRQLASARQHLRHGSRLPAQSAAARRAASLCPARARAMVDDPANARGSQETGLPEHFGRITSRELDLYGFPGSEWLAGITDPPWVRHGEFFENWLRAIPGQVVELSCHPGHLDMTLPGRDCVLGDNLMERRVDEYALLGRPELIRTIEDAGFALQRPPSSARSRYGMPPETDAHADPSHPATLGIPCGCALGGARLGCHVPGDAYPPRI